MLFLLYLKNMLEIKFLLNKNWRKTALFYSIFAFTHFACPTDIFSWNFYIFKSIWNNKKGTVVSYVVRRLNYVFDAFFRIYVSGKELLNSDYWKLEEEIDMSAVQIKQNLFRFF